VIHNHNKTSILEKLLKKINLKSNRLLKKVKKYYQPMMYIFI